MPVELWTSEAFHGEVTAWVERSARSHGLALTGEWEQPHARPWSSAISFGSDGGRLWFKVNGPGTHHEAALVGVLGRHVPDLVPEILAVDDDRAWTLMRDAGPVLRTVFEPTQQWSAWAELLPAVGAAQRALRTAVPELLDAGMPEAGAARLPDLARQLLEELAAIPVEEGGVTAEEVRQVEEKVPLFEEACTELAASGVEETVVHGDLHSANICWSADGPRIIDWGDSVLGHPFGEMLGTLNSLAWHAKLERDDPQVVAARDAYLSAYADCGTHDELLRWTLLARRTGVVNKALAWARAFKGEPATAQDEFEWPVREWLLDLREFDQLA